MTVGRKVVAQRGVLCCGSVAPEHPPRLEATCLNPIARRKPSEQGVGTQFGPVAMSQF